MPKAPLIGSFSGPPGNVPRTVPSLPRKEVEEDVPSASGTGDASVVEAVGKTSAGKSPKEKAEEYVAGLARVGLSETDARAILEKVLVNRVYMETLAIGPVQVVLRTRNYRDVTRALQYLEVEKPTYSMAINDLIARYNMAASLVRFGSDTFKHPRKEEGATDEEMEDAFHDRLSYIMEMPIVSMNRLMQLVHDFDEKIAAVFAEGAPEDF